MNTFGSAAIIAGGKSSRMGFDKQLLTIDDTYIYHRNIAVLSRIFDDILVVTNTPEIYKDENVRTCHDVFADMGPLAGIHAALSNTQSKYTFLIACDMPVINPDYISYMKQLIEISLPDICVTRINERFEAFNSFFSVRLMPLIADTLIERGKRSSSIFRFINTDSVTKEVVPESQAVRFDPQLNMFKNLNTAEDFKSFNR